MNSLKVCPGCMSDMMEVSDEYEGDNGMEGAVMDMMELIWHDGDNDIECGVDSGIV